MSTKTSLILAAVLTLGLATAAQAGAKDDGEQGGFRVGPLGQTFGDSSVNPVYHRSLHNNAAKAFASARHQPTTRY
jgi:hypothetical protein